MNTAKVRRTDPKPSSAYRIWNTHRFRRCASILRARLGSSARTRTTLRPRPIGHYPGVRPPTRVHVDAKRTIQSCGFVSNFGERFGINTDPAALASVLLEQSVFRMHPPLQKSSAIPALPWPSNTTFEVFTRVGPDNSLERLTERSVGLVTDRPSDVYELLVTLFE